MKIAFQGVRGAYSEMAINSYFKEEKQVIGLPISEDVCEALIKGKVDVAALPIENSIVGNVNVNLELIYKHNFSIIGEHFQEINHNLLVCKNTKLAQVKKVYSHPIALDQCRDFLKKNNIEAIPTYDTAGACLKVKNSNNIEIGAIASKLCEEYYDLDLIEKNIQTNSNNLTRFIFFTTKENKPSNISMEKTTLAFKTAHKPGALLDCLQVFACFKINLTRLISKTVPEDTFSYVFFIDFEGGKNEERIQLALKALKLHTKEIKILGSYPL